VTRSSDGSGLLDSLDDRRREQLTNLALIVLSVSVAFAGLEAGLRVGAVPYDRDVSSEDIHCTGPETIHQFHPDYGWTLTANATYIRHWKKPGGADAWYYFDINSEGFRDTYDRGERNVIVVGDSFTEGAGVTQGGQYATLLDHWTPNTAFHAYGAGGYGTDQELLVYRNVADRYEHDLVILQYYYGNDARNNVGEGWPPGPRRPRFELRDGELTQVHEPVDRLPSDAAGFRDYGAVGKLHNTLKDTFWAYDWTYRRTRTLAVRIGLVGGGGGGNDGPPTPPTGAERREQLRLTSALIAEVGDEARAHDAHVLVVGVPARGEVRPEAPAHYPPESGIPYYRDQRETLRDVAANHSNVTFLSLKPTVQREVDAGRQMYGEEVANAHFVARGYRVMARTIYDHVTSEGYVPKGSPDFGADYRETRRTCN
jgi:hypothetical protein